MKRRKQPLNQGLLVSLAALGVFAGLALNVKPGPEIPADNLLTQFDQGLDQRLHEINVQSPAEARFFGHVTDLGSSRWLMWLGLTVLVLLILVPAFLLRYQRRPIWILVRGCLLALIWMLALVGGEMFNHGLKESIKRIRPPYHEAVHASGYSFPSGHSMESLVAYGMLAYFLVLFLPVRRARIAAVGFLAGLVLMIGFSRIFLGAHWFSDVVGGFAAGGFWLALCISAVEMVRRRSPRSPAEQPAPITLEAAVESAAEKVAAVVAQVDAKVSLEANVGTGAENAVS
jgi:undecaprenyl-diphosphatase